MVTRMHLLGALGGLFAASAIALGVALSEPAKNSDMVFVAAGEAVLGGNNFAEMPGPARHYVKSYWIDRYEVTNAAYEVFVADTHGEPPLFSDDPLYSKPDQPVTGVTRFDAEDYCVWRGKRLPTEFEWEKAARGTDGRLYPWGNEEDMSRAILGGSAPAAVTDQPHDISPYGVVGMAGNVSEWVQEMFVGGPSCLNPDSVAIQTSTQALTKGDLKFKAYIRGNNFQGLPHMTKLAHHLWDYPDTLAEFVGFRCARDAKSEQAALQ